MEISKRLANVEDEFVKRFHDRCPVSEQYLNSDIHLHIQFHRGFDLIAQGMGGIMHVTGEPDGPPTSVGLPICDLGTGMCRPAGSPPRARAIRERCGIGEVPLICTPVRIAEGVRVRTVAPKLGQHNAEIFGRLGLSEAELKELLDKRVL